MSLWCTRSARRRARIHGASREGDVFQGPVRVEQTPVLRKERQEMVQHVSKQVLLRDECLNPKDVQARRHQTGPSTAARGNSALQVSYLARPPRKGPCRK